MHRRAAVPALGALAALWLVGPPAVRAANDAWSTTPASGNFSGANWTTGATTPGAATGTIAAGDALYFGTSSVTTLNDDEAAGFNLASLTFNAGAATFTIAGNSFALAGGITNNSSVLQTINDAFTVTSGSTFTAATGNLTLGGNVTGTAQTNDIDLSAAAGTVTLGGTNSFTAAGSVVEVTGGTLNITGTTGINLSGSYFSNTGATTTVANGGTLNVSGANLFYVGTFGAGTLNVNGTMNVSGGAQIKLSYNSAGTLNLNSSGLLTTATAIATNGGNSVVNLNGGTLRATAAVTNLLSGTATTSSTASTIDSNSFAVSVSSVIGNGATAGGLTIVDSSAGGGGSVTLSGNNTYTGGTVVNSGNLKLAAGGGQGAVRGALTVNPGATLTLSAGNALGYTAGTQVTTLNINGGTVNTTGALGDEGYLTTFNLTGGTLAYTGTNAANAYQIAAGDATAPSIISNASATTSTISGNVNIRSGTLPITVAKGTTASGVDLQVSGVISGTGFGVTKAGAGMLLLSAANTYTGATTVNAGTLNISGSISSTAVNVAAGALTLSNAAAIVLPDTSTLSLVSGTTLNLNAASGTSETIGTLVLDGTTEPTGTYTANQLSGLDGNITFTSLNGETLTVGAVPEPTTLAGGVFLMAAFGWHLRTLRRRVA